MDYGRQIAPRHTSLITAGAETGDLTVSFFINRRGKIRTAPSLVPNSSLPAYVSVDGTLRYDLGGKATIVFGVKNLFDKEPIPVALPRLNGFPQYYDVIGRRFSLGVKASF
ncbi:MAG: TonB-dependent receptor [Parvularculaceae bacterium]